MNPMQEDSMTTASEQDTLAQIEENVESTKPKPAWMKKQYNILERTIRGRDGTWLVNRCCKACHGTGIIGFQAKGAMRYAIYCKCPVKKEQPKETEECPKTT